MHATARRPLNRRRFLASAVSLTLAPQRHPTAGQQVHKFDLGHGLTIVDYRLLPTKDVMRFILEIRNDSDTAVDCPVVGMVVPHLDPAANFAWGNPTSAVLHPHSSEILVGVVPSSALGEGDLDDASWMLCGPIRTEYATQLQGHNIDFTDQLNIVDSEQAEVHFEIKNRGTRRAASVLIQGLVRDSKGRACGAILPTSLQFLGPGEAGGKQVNINRRSEFIASPFTLLNSLEGISVECSLQIRMGQINAGCPAAMPWNR